MSRLTQKEPRTVMIDGGEYPINTDFRNCLLTWDALCDWQEGGLTEGELTDIVRHNMFPAKQPENPEEMVRQIVRYLTQDKEPDKAEQKRPAMIDFEQDGQLIYDAFLLKGISLDSAKLTFREFLSHLREIPKDCMLCRVVYLRTQNRRGKLTKEERRECENIGWDVIRINENHKDIDDPF